MEKLSIFLAVPCPANHFRRTKPQWPFLGVTFLLLVVFSQIWHAAVERAQRWIWWASGIALGVAILTLFALFDKRRNDVLKMIDDIKRWR